MIHEFRAFDDLLLPFPAADHDIDRPFFVGAKPYDAFEWVEGISSPDFNVRKRANRFPKLVVQHSFVDRQQIDVVRGSWKSASGYCRSADQRVRDLLFFEKPADAFDEGHVNRPLCCASSGGRFGAPRESAIAPPPS